jgi:hypothetical protein
MFFPFVIVVGVGQYQIVFQKQFGFQSIFMQKTNRVSHSVIFEMKPNV